VAHEPDETMKKIAFIIPPRVELLDLAGPVQVFTEARFHGLEIVIEFYRYRGNPVCTSGLGFGELPYFADAKLAEGDFVFMPGMDQNYVRSSSFTKEAKFFAWLKKCHARNVNICSVCNGAFALGHAGLLSKLECTTHWRRLDELQLQFPETKVLADVLYVKNDHICTSGGVSAGIDLALSILQDIGGTPLTHKVARGLVLYYRKNGNSNRETDYSAFRNHINLKIHEVQDYIIENISKDTSIIKLAAIGHMSPRNLTRVFKETTAATINDYLSQVRLDTANTLLKNPKNTMSIIASMCGFKSQRQLQRLLKDTQQ
jgi:transcriptional regulator GlxA family with amidase domain